MPLIPFRDLPDAGLARRLAAALYDGLLILALWFFLGFVLAVIESIVQPRDPTGVVEPLVPAAFGPLVTLALWLIAAGFYVWFWRRGGQTLGMKTWHLRLITVDGRPLTPAMAWTRAAVGTLSWLALGAGYLWLLVAGRTWHDLASHTRVVVLPKESR